MNLIRRSRDFFSCFQATDGAARFLGWAHSDLGWLPFVHFPDHAQDMDAGAIRAWEVWFSRGGWLRPMLLWVLRKPDTGTAEVHRRMRRKAARNEDQPRGSALAARTPGLPRTTPFGICINTPGTRFRRRCPRR